MLWLAQSNVAPSILFSWHCWSHAVKDIHMCQWTPYSRNSEPVSCPVWRIWTNISLQTLKPIICPNEVSWKFATCGYAYFVIHWPHWQCHHLHSKTLLHRKNQQSVDLDLKLLSREGQTISIKKSIASTWLTIRRLQENPILCWWCSWWVRPVGKSSRGKTTWNTVVPTMFHNHPCNALILSNRCSICGFDYWAEMKIF